MAKKWKGLFLHVDQDPSFVYVTVKYKLHVHEITKRSTNIMRFWKPRLTILSKHSNYAGCLAANPGTSLCGTLQPSKKRFCWHKENDICNHSSFFFILNLKIHGICPLAAKCMLHSYPSRLHPSTFPVSAAANQIELHLEMGSWKAFTIPSTRKHIPLGELNQNHRYFEIKC